MLGSPHSVSSLRFPRLRTPEVRQPCSTPPHPRHLIRAALLALFLVVGSGLPACETDPPALTVGELAFSTDDVRGLSEDQLRRLARIGAVGLAVREDAHLELGRPLLELQLQDALIQRLREELVLRWAEVDDEVLEAHYQTQPEWELEVRHLIRISERWRPEEHRRDARRQAQAALERVQAGEPFAEVAGEVSEEPGAAERGGLLEPGRQGTWVSEFWDAAVELEPGEVSGVVATEYGFHVLKLEDRRQIPFAEARDRVASEVAAMLSQRARWEAWVEERAEDIELHLDRLPSAELPSEEDSGVVARWNREELTAGEVASRLPGLRADTVDAFGRDDEEVRRAVVREAALTNRLLREARSRQVGLPDSRVAEIERAWERTVARWAAAFRFEVGMPLDQLRERALEGLTDTGQNLRIARREVDQRGPTLDHAYDMSLPER